MTRHHHHLPYWDDRDLALVHYEDASTHEDHHRRYSIPREACEDPDCEAAQRWDDRPKRRQLTLDGLISVPKDERQSERSA